MSYRLSEIVPVISVSPLITTPWASTTRRAAAATVTMVRRRMRNVHWNRSKGVPPRSERDPDRNWNAIGQTCI